MSPRQPARRSEREAEWTRHESDAPATDAFPRVSVSLSAAATTDIATAKRPGVGAAERLASARLGDSFATLASAATATLCERLL
eukprot:972115-Prymnesium_polylepis.1